MHRKRDVERNLCAHTMSQRVQDNYTRDLCKIDRLSHEKMAKARLKATQSELERNRLAETQRMREKLEAEQRLERAKSALVFEEQRQKMCDEKRRQKLREENEELRVLEQQLRTAYVTKELHSQIRQKQAQALQEKIAVERENLQLEEQRLKLVQQEREREKRQEADKQKFRESLQQQMRETFARKRVKYEQFLREKQIIDAIVQRLQEERLEDLQMKAERIQAALEDMRNIKQNKELYKVNQAKINDEENCRITEYLREKEMVEQQQTQLRRELLTKKTELSDRLSSNLEAIRLETRRKEELLVELHMKELREREEAKLRKDLEAQLRRRIEVRLDLEKQREHLWIRREQDKEEERLYREQQLQELAERDKLDLLSNEMKRRKQIEHRQEIRQILDQRRQQRIDELNALKGEYDRDLRDADSLRKMIEEERIKLLREHATELIGFLPIGLLRNSTYLCHRLATKTAGESTKY